MTDWKTTLIFACFCSIAAADDNLIANPGFEDSIHKEWTLHNFDGAETIGKLTFVNDKPFQGKQAARITRVSHGGLTGMAQTIKAAENTAYRLTLQCRTEGKSAAFAHLFFLNDAGSTLGETVSKDISAPAWTPLNLDFRTPASTDAIRLVLALRGTDSADFDNVALRHAKVQEMAEWGDFEARCIPVDTVEAWSGKPVFTTFTDSPCSLTFQFKGNPKTLKKPALCLDLPADLKMVESFQQHPAWGTHLQPETADVMHDGVRYIRYRFVNPPFLQTIMPSWGWRRMLSVLFLPPDENTPGDIRKAFWHIENNGISKDEQTFDIRFLPPLPDAKMPSDFHVGFWCGYENDIPDQKIMDRVVSRLRRSNMTGTNALSELKPNTERFRNNGWNVATVANQVDQAYQFNSLTDAQKEKFKDTMFSVDHTGKTARNRMCPHFFLHDMEYRAIAEQRVKSSLKDCRPGDMVFLDSEPWRPHEWCFCKRCIEDFKQFANLTETPSVQKINGELRAKWRDFRVEQCCRIIAELAALTRKFAPKARIFDYDYPINYDSQKAIDTFLSRCSKHSLRNEAVLDGHISSFYHTLDEKMFDETAVSLKHLKKDYMPLFAVDPPGYLAKTSVLSPQRFRTMMEGAAALGSKGVWIYSTTVVDGSMAQAIHEGMARIAKVEDFYRKGIRTAQPKKLTVLQGNAGDKIRHIAFELDKRILHVIFNYDTANTVTVELPCANGRQATDAISGKKLPRNGKGLPVSLKPSNVRYLLVN